MTPVASTRIRRPDPSTAMRRLMARAREMLADADLASLTCDGDCGACLIKQVEVFEQSLADWEARLAQGETPTLGDLKKMAQWGWALTQRLLDSRLAHAAALEHYLRRPYQNRWHHG